MNEDLLRKGLLEENVLKEIAYWTRTKGAGFLIYITEDGKVSYGKPVADNQEKLKKLQDNKLTFVSDDYWEAWKKYAEENVSAYLDSYYQNNETKIDKNSGLLLLTKWRENITDEGLNALLRNALKNGSRGHTSLELVLTINDYIELNELHEYRINTEFVRGELKETGSKIISLLIASQNFNKIHLNLLKEAAKADIVEYLLPKTNKIFNYQKTRGILNLENNDLLLDTDF